MPPPTPASSSDVAPSHERETLSPQRLRETIRQMIALVTSTTQQSRETVDRFKSSTAAADHERDETRRQIETRLAAGKKAAEKALRTQRQTIESTFTHDHERTELEYQSSLARIGEKAETNEKQAAKALQESIWLTETVFDATETQPEEQFEQARKAVEGQLQELDTLREKASVLIESYRQRVPEIEEPVAPGSNSVQGDPQQQLATCCLDVRTKFEQLDKLVIPRQMRGVRPLLIVVGVAILAAAVATFLSGWKLNTWVAVSGGAAAVLGFGGLLALHAVARAQVANLYRPMLASIACARGAAQQSIAVAEQLRDLRKAQLIEQRDRDLAAARQKHETVLASINERREHHLQRLHEKYPNMLGEIRQKHDDDLRTLQQKHDERLTALGIEHETAAQQMSERYTQQTAESRAQYESDWNALQDRWRQGMVEAYSVIDEVNHESERTFPAWSDPSWRDWTPPFDFTRAIRFGQMRLDLRALPGGVPEDQRLILPGPATVDIPALLALPNECSMLLQAGADGRGAAVEALQAVMFRLLTTLPPGKVRFTIIDPIGLGQNFAGFMHLADYEGAFVADKIWTEERHIEQRLVDLTEHMENVIQKYLRNEYETIEQYNIDAGEIAEPFRFLVIANFPANFNENASRRLASVIASGARCGVYTLITCDTRQPLPPGIELTDLERNSVNLVYDNNQFIWKDPVYSALTLALDEPPDEQFLTEKLHLIGASAKDSSRVEVPFANIAPSAEEYWTGDTSSDVRVALGRSGATKLQYLTLGQGTSQHALIAGKTGSGKSTLLHALITNLALWYSPDEVEFYLIDFKKGVEFKTYATHELPHARAVAIESDREFGLSVLQRLDAELKQRGSKYRELGVQDLAAYRRLTSASAHRDGNGEAKGTNGKGSPAMPRVLLIIDEFQELFTEDDKIAQDAALLLDRLVRQGRAFGMHVLLGSQTLGGAYSLARSTIGQMGVRIALQCSEADSFLILSDDNAAARLLSRPGEAIYNDASGMVEGNSPFQVCWLPEEQREFYLQQVADLAEARGQRPTEPQIVFEGNIAADLGRNVYLSNLLSQPDWPGAPPAAPRAWLGEPIAIKDPTAAALRRQSGSNMMIIGQRDEAALAMMASSIISLAAQHAPSHASFYILDGSPVDAPTAGYLANVSSILPHKVHNVGYRDVGGAMAEIASKLKHREETRAADAAAIYIMIYSLQRFRMLRQEDDFSFSASDPDAPPPPEKLFAQIIREGPAVGIHTLLWCDTANNLNRSLDRLGLREFEIRVLFQMGASDSSNIIDSPLAAKLGFHRALFYSEEQGYLEKFRPYALPSDELLADMARRFAARSVRK